MYSLQNMRIFYINQQLFEVFLPVTEIIADNLLRKHLTEWKTYICPLHVPHVLPLKLQVFSNHFLSTRVRDTSVKVKERKHPRYVNDSQSPGNTNTC